MKMLFAVLLSVALLPAASAELAQYRGFRFGDDLKTTVKAAGVKPDEVKLVHERPRTIHEIEWYRPWVQNDALKPDPVRTVLLNFLDGKLYRMVIAYDRFRLEGMTADDMVEAISSTYGPAERPGDDKIIVRASESPVKVIARWQNADYSYDLVRTSDELSYLLVLYSKQQNPLAETAMRESARLELLNAPQRALAVDQKRAEEEKSAREKARVANKPNFRP